jgi:hypothetical protein
MGIRDAGSAPRTSGDLADHAPPGPGDLGGGAANPVARPRQEGVMRVVDGSWVGTRIGTAVGLAPRSCDFVKEGTEAVRSGRLLLVGRGDTPGAVALRSLGVRRPFSAWSTTSERKWSLGGLHGTSLQGSLSFIAGAAGALVVACGSVDQHGSQGISERGGRTDGGPFGTRERGHNQVHIKSKEAPRSFYVALQMLSYHSSFSWSSCGITYHRRLCSPFRR